MKRVLSILLALLLSVVAFAQSHISDTSFVINKHRFKIQTRDIANDSVLLKIYCQHKLVMKDSFDGQGLAPLTYPDLNKDGNCDIMLTYTGNNDSYFICLFDAVHNTFKNLDGFDRFPEAVQLKTNRSYYYSYNRAGCADYNWESYLFTIKNFKAIAVGYIFAQGCEYKVKENPQTIKIYKIFKDDEGNEKLITRLPYVKFVSKFGEKWDFIEAYWNKNYTKFR